MEANTSKERRIPHEQLAEAARVHYTLRRYLKEMEEQNPVGQPVHEAVGAHISQMNQLHGYFAPVFLNKATSAVSEEASFGD